MHPILFRWDTPEFLHRILPASLTVYSYGVLILIGAALAYWYTAWQVRRAFAVPSTETLKLLLWLLLAGYVGGRLFYLLDAPGAYIDRPAALFSGGGFVFYGSALAVIPVILWFIKGHGLPYWPMLDILVITTCIVHAAGRFGCLLAGCCYGVPGDGWASITFKDPESLARPLYTPLRPTQIYSILKLTAILVVLIAIKQRRRFAGQVAASYLVLYGAGRFLLEYQRGDDSRGFLVEGALSNAQGISIIAVLSGSALYLHLRASARRSVPARTTYSRSCMRLRSRGPCSRLRP